MNINDYLAKQYGPRGCWLLVADVYAHELDKVVTGFRAINSSVRAIATQFRLALHKNPDGLAQLEEPAEMCIVLMSKAEGLSVHHCGVYVNGGVLHALDTGPVWEEMPTLLDAYKVVEFWGLAA